MNRFDALFADPNRRAFLPFFTVGDPDFDTSLRLICASVKAGADAIELGFPFADPIADGPTNQRSMLRAINSGMNFDRCLELVSCIRARYPKLPIGLLLYYNLLHRRGLNQAAADLERAGVDAVVSADCPLEESGPLTASLTEHNLGVIHMVAPNTSDSRAQLLFANSRAFTYVLSGFGTTGVKEHIDPRTIERVSHLRQLTDKPMVVGFGISQPEHVRFIWQAGANGAIVGSYFSQLIERNLGQIDLAVAAITTFIHQLQEPVAC